MLTEKQIEELIEELVDEYIEIENNNLWIKEAEKRKMIIDIKIDILKKSIGGIRMEKETILEIEFQPVWDKWAWRITKQNEEILKRNEFIDKKLNIVSFRSPEFSSSQNKLFIKGSAKRWDDNINICTTEEKALIEEKVKAINEKYRIKKRWRAKYNEIYCYIDEFFEIKTAYERETEKDNEKYKVGNYFEIGKEAQGYAEYMKKCSLKWHEMRKRNE